MLRNKARAGRIW